MVYITLHLKKQWFEKIKSGEKTHEYRIANDYWHTRIQNLIDKGNLYGESIGIVFKLGYPKKDNENNSLIAVITEEPLIINGKNTDLSINKPVYDLKFRLLG